MMTSPHLLGFESLALHGADLLDDVESAGALAEAIDRAACDDADRFDRVQDLRELAALALVAARRIEKAA
jgi:hypothetical protein